MTLTEGEFILAFTTIFVGPPVVAISRGGRTNADAATRALYWKRAVAYLRIGVLLLTVALVALIAGGLSAISILAFWVGAGTCAFARANGMRLALAKSALISRHTAHLEEPPGSN